MKIRVFTLLALLLCAGQPVWAYTSPLHKLASGVKQVVTGPFSIITVPIEQMKRENDEVLGVIGGLMEGAAQSAIIPLKGLFNIATFPFVDYSDTLDE